MYYRLKDNFILRGYELLPYAVVNLNTGAVGFVDLDMMNVLELCNGSVEIPPPQSVNPAKIRECIDTAKNAGLLEESSEPLRGLNDVQKYKRYPARYIREAQWSITGRCNYRCKHCFMSAPESKLGELDHNTIMNIIQQLGDCGVMNVSLTGGEPLIRDDFLEIVDALLERNIRITCIYSNGALVNEKLLRELDARNIHPEFNMSYDGPGWHDWLRGINGAEESVNRAFALCRDMGFPTGAEMCLHQHNKHTLRESVKHLASLGVLRLKVSPVSDSGEWLKHGGGLSITTKETYSLYLDYIPHYYEDDMPLSIMLGGLFTARPDKPGMFWIPAFKPGNRDPKDFCICGHARLVMYISPEGRVLPCMTLSGMKIQEDFPLITEKTLSQCITDSYYMRLINTRASEYLALNEECNACKYARHCYGGCRADSLQYDESNIMGKSPSICELFMGGWVDKVIEAVKKVRPNADSPVFTSPLWSALK